MPPSGPQIEWAQRVLGVSSGQSKPNGPAPLAPLGPLATDLTAAREGLVTARDTMTDALSKADLQIRKLQAVLAVHPDSQLKEIAGSPDLGINALTGNYRVRVLAALRDIEIAPQEKLPAVLQKARTLVAGFDNHIQTSDRLAACDENPLKVPVSVRAVLAPALSDLARSIEKFAA
jgi:hypothetical protein